MVKLDALTKLIGTNPKEINLFFENWKEHTENERLNVIRALREEGQLSVKYKTTENDTDFRCPLYNFMLTKACSINSCPYHLITKYSDPSQVEAVTHCKNCLINCIDKAKNNRMSANEASTLLGMSISEVNNTNASAIAKIRKTKIKEHLEKYQIPRYKYIPGHCISCEQYIQDEIDMNLWPELIIEPGKYGWCCSACREAKPKWQFLVEKEFECQFLQAVATGVLIYKNLEMLGNIFNLNKETIQKYKPEVLETLDELRKFFIDDK